MRRSVSISLGVIKKMALNEALGGYVMWTKNKNHDIIFTSTSYVLTLDYWSWNLFVIFYLSSILEALSLLYSLHLYNTFYYIQRLEGIVVLHNGLGRREGIYSFVLLPQRLSHRNACSVSGEEHLQAFLSLYLS